MSRVLYALGRVCVRHRYVVLAIWVALLAGTVAVANEVGKQTSDNLTVPGSGSTHATNLLDDNLPDQANGTNPVVMEARTGDLTSGANEKAVRETVKKLKSAPHVTKAISPLGSQGSSLLSKD